MQSTLHYPLNEILGSRASLLVLRALHRHGGEMSVSALVAHTGLSKRGVHHAIRALEALRIVWPLGTGRAKLFRARADHPLFSPISQLFKAEEARYDAILGAIRAIADADDAILAVWLYGSVARNEDGSQSDLDLALAVEKGKAPAVEAKFRERIAGVEELLAFDSNVIAIDVDDVARLSHEADPWWISLNRDALAIRGDRPDLLLRRTTLARKAT
jgi:predicted nucleotidyltransferase